MCPNTTTRKFVGPLTSIQMQIPSKVVKVAGCHLPLARGYLSDSSKPNLNSMSHTTTGSLLTYQIGAAIYNQRHKRRLIQASGEFYDDNVLRKLAKFENPFRFRPLLAAIDTSKGGPVRESGGRLGRLDSANEAGMFHKINKSKLEQVKKSLKDKPPEKAASPDPVTKTEQ